MSQHYFLGIETSCDDTGVAIVRMQDGERPEVVAEELASQVDVHREYNGVVPELASRAHMRNLPLVYSRVLEKAQMSLSDMSCVCVTVGPGLKGCLLMGLSFAKGLSLVNKVPLLGVNHIEGHVLAPMLDNPELKFPYLALVVSGGHTELQEVHGVGDYRLVARTTDDAAGEAFDKSATLLGIDYPGGPELARLADSVDSSPFELPKVMRQAKGFSFSGLKTAISLLVKENQEVLTESKASLAHAIQESIVDALLFKLKKALKTTGLKQVAVTGGVSANKRLREAVTKLSRGNAYFPKMSHTIDNAAMIAYVGGLRYLQGETSESDISVQSRWPIETTKRSALV